MSLADIVGGPTRSSRPTGGQRAKVVRPPSALDASLTVSLLSYTSEYEYEVPGTNWVSRGMALPAQGTVGVAIFDDHGDTWFLIGGGTTFPAGGGGTEQWFSQAGAPAGATGTIGDWSLDSVSGDFYEKTGTTTWTLRGNLKGPTGATGAAGPPGTNGTNGTPGEKWFTQSGVPAGGTGIVGDWSLDSATGDYYEKTGASTWTLRGNLKGPTGATGSTGSTGPAGAPGSLWRSGTGAPAGALGIVGDWYLNDANGDVYEKTGASTYTLRDNLTGPTGSTGSTGSAGAPGSIWRSGTGAPSGALGIVGDWYENDANGDIYEKTGASTYTLRDNLTGPAGPSGASTFVSGSGAPGAGVGVDGSIYLDYTSLRFWGPKAAGAWPGTAFGRLEPLNPTWNQVKTG